MSVITRRRFGQLTAGAALMLPQGRASAEEGWPRMENICDCHVHIIGPLAEYPMSPKRLYTPPQAAVVDLLALRETLGVARNILVQPSFYGTDNSCMLTALAELGASARAIAVVAPDISDEELSALDGKGVRGLRFNLESGADRDPTAATMMLDALAVRIARLGWHIQIYAALPVIAALTDRIGVLPVPLVIDHFGMPKAEEGIGQPGFSALIELLRAGKAYVKLSAPYRIARAAPYPDVAPLARALIEAAPDRLVWASDWPHTDRVPGKAPFDIHPFRKIDDSAALGAVTNWCGTDKGLMRAILVDTPAKLYRF